MDKRDANEKGLVAEWRALGCVWIPQDRHAGFDGVLISPRTGIHIVEVKNPKQNWRLTDAEQMMRDRIGDQYEIAEYSCDILV